MVQAIDRLRLIHCPRKKTVIILCNIPLDIPIDELVTWRELVGDDRLAKALEECEQKGREALPLVPTALGDLFPDLWATEKAAERWLTKNPLNPSISLIRLWGVLADYRCSHRHRRWSKAVIRHGADARVAIAAVLGVPAEDIRIREDAGFEPSARANTAPTSVPSSPNTPNTAVTGTR